MTRPSFKYVYLPADTQVPPEERSLTIPEGEDKDVSCLFDHLKGHFQQVGQMSDAAKEAHKQSILALLGENASKIDLSKLDMAAGIQMVENIGLVAHNKMADFVGVNMYCDDQAIAKELPLNPRASQIAECCGKMVQVRGDAFLARIFDNEDEFKRLDFTLADLSSTAPWVKLGMEQTRRRYQQGPPEASPILTPKSQPSKLKVEELSHAECAKEDGNAAFKRGDLQAALAAYSLALQHDPAMVAAANNRALIHIRLGQHQEAEADCDTVLQHEPRNIKALLRRATAHEALGNAEGAAADLARVLQHEPRNAEAAQALDRLKPPPAPQVQADS